MSWNTHLIRTVNLPNKQTHVMPLVNAQKLGVRGWGLPFLSTVDKLVNTLKLPKLG